MLQDLLKEKEVLKKELVDKANSFVSECTDEVEEVEEVEHIMDMNINFDQWTELEDKVEEYNDILSDIESHEEEPNENTCAFCESSCEEYFCSDDCRIADVEELN